MHIDDYKDNNVDSIFETAKYENTKKLHNSRKRITRTLLIIAGADVGIALIYWMIYGNFDQNSSDMVRSLYSSFLLVVFGLIAHKMPRVAVWCAFAAYLSGVAITICSSPETTRHGLYIKALIFSSFIALLRREI